MVMQEGEKTLLEDQFMDCRIWFDLEGSDHAPVWADLQPLKPLLQGTKPPSLDVRNRQTGTGDLGISDLHVRRAFLPIVSFQSSAKQAPLTCAHLVGMV